MRTRWAVLHVSRSARALGESPSNHKSSIDPESSNLDPGEATDGSHLPSVRRRVTDWVEEDRV